MHRSSRTLKSARGAGQLQCICRCLFALYLDGLKSSIRVEPDGHVDHITRSAGIYRPPLHGSNYECPVAFATDGKIGGFKRRGPPPNSLSI